MQSALPAIFRLAKNVSSLSNHKYKIGAVIVEKGKPISVGHNWYRTHPDAKWSGLHAEIVAMRATGKNRIKGASIFVYREYRDGSPALARPCEDCMIELKKFGIRKVWYTTNEYPFFEMEIIQI